MRKLLSSNQGLYFFALAAFVVIITGTTGIPFVGADSQVGGIITEDTTWTAENSPYEITETVQIPSEVTLTIESGVMISKPSSGDIFVLMGTIRAHGTSQKPIVIDGGGNSNIIYTQPGYGYGDFQYCIIKNGYEFWDRWGHLDLRYSELVNLGTSGNWAHSIIKLDGPSGESNIEFNKFINTGGISSYNDHYGTNIRYNLFQGLLSPLAHMGGGTPSDPPKEMIVRYNSFIDTEELALYLESGFIGWSPSIDAAENYWDTMDTDIIDQMIWDRNDDITIDNDINYSPILTEPHPDTPEVSYPPITPCNPSPANHASSVSVDAELSWTGGAPDAENEVNYDVYFGTSENPPLNETIGPYPATQSLITYDRGTLIHHTTYYWKIVARDNHGTETESSVWEFTTAEEIVEYYLTISSTAGGCVVEPGEGTFTYNEGTVVDLRVAVEEESSRFVNWTGDVDTVADVNASVTTITMDDDYSITANFKERTNWLKIGVTIAIAVLVLGLASFFFLRWRKKAA